ncbi:MAG: hypothetical protein J6S92_09045, partial [Oscillospiraceae bacterium]|nr:hypothetical protein [Oscillospiraceae bacterium]
MEKIQALYQKLEDAGVIGHQQIHFEECKKIWQTLVPQVGQADSVQGEMLREMEKLRYEACANGNKNWDDQFAWFCGNVGDLLTDSGMFDRSRLEVLRTALDYLKACGEYAARYHDPAQDRSDLNPDFIAHTNDDVYDFIEEFLAEYSLAHREPVPYEKKDFVRRYACMNTKNQGIINKEAIALQIRFNEDQTIVEKIREGLKKKDGYCPCRIQR